MWIKKIAMETRAENHIELLVKTPGNGQKQLNHWELWSPSELVGSSDDYRDH